MLRSKHTGLFLTLTRLWSYSSISLPAQIYKPSLLLADGDDSCVANLNFLWLDHSIQDTSIYYNIFCMVFMINENFPTYSEKGGWVSLVVWLCELQIFLEDYPHLSHPATNSSRVRRYYKLWAMRTIQWSNHCPGQLWLFTQDPHSLFIAYPPQPTVSHQFHILHSFCQVTWYESLLEVTLNVCLVV